MSLRRRYETRSVLVLSALGGGSDGFHVGDSQFIHVGLVLLAARFVAYLGLRVAEPFSYVRWTGVVFALAAVTVVAADANGYTGGSAFVSIFVALAPLVGVFLASLLAAALGWASFDAIPLSTFGPVGAGMAVLGVVAFLVGHGAQAVID